MGNFQGIRIRYNRLVLPVESLTVTDHAIDLVVIATLGIPIGASHSQSRPAKASPKTSTTTARKPKTKWPRDRNLCQSRKHSHDRRGAESLRRTREGSATRG